MESRWEREKILQVLTTLEQGWVRQKMYLLEQSVENILMKHILPTETANLLYFTTVSS